MTDLTRRELEGLRHALAQAPTADSFRASAPNGVVGFLHRLRQWDQADRQPWLRRLDAFLADAEDGGCRDGRHTSNNEGTDTSAPAAHAEVDAELDHAGHGVGMANLHESGDAEVPHGRAALQLCPVCGERPLTPAQTACSPRCRQRRSRRRRFSVTPVTPPLSAPVDTPALADITATEQP
jgi:predicted nucleic acid-binding Zn ribbon protein